MMYRNDGGSAATGERGSRDTAASAHAGGAIWRRAAQVILAAALILAAAAMTAPPGAPLPDYDGPGALSRSCDAAGGEWIYLGRLGSPFVPCPPR